MLVDVIISMTKGHASETKSQNLISISLQPMNYNILGGLMQTFCLLDVIV